MVILLQNMIPFLCKAIIEDLMIRVHRSKYATCIAVFMFLFVFLQMEIVAHGGEHHVEMEDCVACHFSTKNSDIEETSFPVNFQLNNFSLSAYSVLKVNVRNNMPFAALTRAPPKRY